MCRLRSISLVYLCLYLCFGPTTADDDSGVTLIIDSTSEKEGFITSPNFPYSSESKEETRRYKFLGRPEERVQIIFHDVDVYSNLPPNKEHLCRWRYSFASFERDRADTVFLCGPRPLPLLSEKSKFILKYEVPTNFHGGKTFRGFNASYKFITNLGVNSGRQIGINKCHFIYDSSTTTSGSFNSPNFPGFYPRDTKCRFKFHSDEEMFLKLDFTEFNLPGESNENCSSEIGDVLEITGTRNLLSFREEHCGKQDPFSITVNASFFTVLFEGSWSNTHDDSIFEQPEFIGFRANYHFMNEDEKSSDLSSSSSGSSSYYLMFIIVLCLVIAVSFYFIGWRFIQCVQHVRRTFILLHNQ